MTKPHGSPRYASSHRLSSWTHTQVGLVRRAIDSDSALATSRGPDPMWSKWPCETSITSHRFTSSAVLGDVGLPNHGSSNTTLPPGVRSSMHEWPYQVNVAPSAIGPPFPYSRCVDSFWRTAFRMLYRMLAVMDPLI